MCARPHSPKKAVVLQDRTLSPGGQCSLPSGTPRAPLRTIASVHPRLGQGEAGVEGGPSGASKGLGLLLGVLEDVSGLALPRLFF